MSAKRYKNVPAIIAGPKGEGSPYIFFPELQEKDSLKQTVAQLKANIEGLQSSQVKQDELELKCMTTANENTKLTRQMETVNRFALAIFMGCINLEYGIPPFSIGTIGIWKIGDMKYCEITVHL